MPVSFASSTPVPEPVIRPATLPEWWYTLLNSLRSTGNPACAETRARLYAARGATVHGLRVWH